ncbi:calcium-binding protein [Shimia ponticola]|uniref:calcium-binding protein n=1 Tax=Shimia ponticola TaxID=2582893 RepID=UPI0011BFCDB7|nr:hypothetical protein [Shimia ponticola]
MFEKTPFETPYSQSGLTEEAPRIGPVRLATPGVVDGTDLADTIGPGTIDADGDEIDGADGLGDVIDAGLGDDTIDAGEGDDRIIGRAGADDINGGAGTDFLDFSASTESVNVSLRNRQGLRGDAAGDTYTSIEGVIGTAFDDDFDGISKRASVIFAGDGKDDLRARGGSVEFYGEAGDDRFFLDEGRTHTNAVFDGGEGFDRLEFFGTQLGQNFRDDVFTGIERFDMKSGTYEFYADQIVDFQQVRGSGTLDIDLNGANKVDLSAIDFRSDTASTILRGSDANEEFIGSEVADTIQAGAGRDILQGGRGADVLTGGAGADRFVFGPATEGARITDFDAATGDRIDLSDFVRSFDFVTLVLGGAGKGGGDEIVDHNAVRGHGGSSHFFITVTQVGDDTELTITQRAPVAGSAPVELDFTLTLTGVTAAELTLDDFVLSNELVEPVPNAQRGVAVVRPETDDTPGIVEGSELADIIDAGFVDADGDEIDGADGLDDVIEAGDGDDIINAGDGNDTIDGGAGADTINGGDGVDTITYANSDAGIRLSLGAGGLEGFGGDAAGDQLNDVEIIIGSDFDDNITSFGQEIHGGAGSDVIRLEAAVDVFGGIGSDIIQVINDAGFDGSIFDGGADGDRFRISRSGETDLRGATFVDIEQLDIRPSLFLAEVTINADQMTFDSVRVSFKGSGELTIHMEDLTEFDLSGYTIFVDRANQGVTYETIFEGDDDGETITGATGFENTIFGRGGADTLTGGTKADLIDGGADNDILSGGAGADILTGGAGADTFVFTAATDADTITDFIQGEDLIDLSPLVRDFDAFILIAPSTEKAGFALLDSSQTRKKGDSTDVTISVSQDGDDAILSITSDEPAAGAALADLDLSITLEGVDALGLTLDDFLF